MVRQQNEINGKKINRRKDKKQKTETHQMHFGKEWKNIKNM